MSDSSLSPLMRQYRDIKQEYPEAILLFRVGDFYEMFYEDAQDAARLLSIALTSRDKNSTHPVPLCGVPYHAATGYIAKLLKAGYLDLFYAVMIASGQIFRLIRLKNQRIALSRAWQGEAK